MLELIVQRSTLQLELLEPPIRIDTKRRSELPPEDIDLPNEEGREHAPVHHLVNTLVGVLSVRPETEEGIHLLPRRLHVFHS